MIKMTTKKLIRIDLTLFIVILLLEIFFSLGASASSYIIQFAYNCEPCGLALEYPIYIDWTITAEAGAEPRDDETAGEFDERIFVGKTGIYEYEAGGKGGIYKFAVPLNVRFTCDFAIDNH